MRVRTNCEEAQLSGLRVGVGCPQQHRGRMHVFEELAHECGLRAVFLCAAIKLGAMKGDNMSLCDLANFLTLSQPTPRELTPPPQTTTRQSHKLTPSYTQQPDKQHKQSSICCSTVSLCAEHTEPPPIHHSHNNQSHTTTHTCSLQKQKHVGQTQVRVGSCDQAAAAGGAAVSVCAWRCVYRTPSMCLSH